MTLFCIKELDAITTASNEYKLQDVIKIALKYTDRNNMKMLRNAYATQKIALIQLATKFTLRFNKALLFK